MGTWDASIFGNDLALDIRCEFLERFDDGEYPNKIKEELLNDECIKEDELFFSAMFSLAYSMWEEGCLDESFLLEVKKVIESGDDLENMKLLGADEKFLKEREIALKEFLEEISVKKE